jgi:predicted KAP-like P-loop ATPase
MWKDSVTEIDFLDFDYLIELLEDTINNEDLLPSSIGVFGDWGSGKSSLIQMSMKKLEEDEDTLCLNFNSWLFEGYEDAKTSLVGSILDLIEDNRTLTETAKKYISGLYKSIDKMKLLRNGVKYGIDFFATGGIGTMTDIALNTFASKLKVHESVDSDQIHELVQNEMTNKALRDDISEFRNNFGKLLKEAGVKKVVVFIDELDRCSPDTILSTLEAIRLFLFVDKMSFIVGADERHIAYAVRKRFEDIEGIQMDIGKEYLEKMIQYTVRIPRLNTKEVEFYLICLLIQQDLTDIEFSDLIEYLKSKKNEAFFDFEVTYEIIKEHSKGIADKVKGNLVVGKQLSNVLATGLNGNPRHCKRFLNSLVMREKMAKSKNIPLNRSILAKIMMIEYFKLPFFKKLADIHYTTGESKKELALIESGELEKSDRLSAWKEDKWVNDWIQLEPKLADVDLTAYFYFTRESLVDKYKIAGTKLTPLAQGILKKLLSKTDIGINYATQNFTDANEHEASEILDEIYRKMMSESELENKLFKSFIKWGLTRDSLYPNVVSYLESIPGTKVKFPVLPLIKEFKDISKLIEQVDRVQTRWGEENDKLTQIIKKQLN